jgi:hypothetical protein
LDKKMALPGDVSRPKLALSRRIDPAALAKGFLIAGDLLVLLAFSYIGQREHETVNAARPLLGVLWTAFPFALSWLVSGWLLGAYQVEVGKRPFLGRSLNAWLVAAPLAILLRAYLLGRAVIPTVFVTAGLGFGGGMMLGWRVLFVWWLAPRRND